MTRPDLTAAPVPSVQRIDPETITEWRSHQGQGMTSAVGEYTPSEFWDLLDAYESVIAMYDAAPAVAQGEK